jgi:RNA polymerase sigma-70 factor (ECF subfamily)
MPEVEFVQNLFSTNDIESVVRVEADAPIQADLGPVDEIGKPRDQSLSETRLLSDQDLVEGILVANEACFSALYERYFDRIYAYSYRRLRNHSDAEEVTQETFVTVFKSISNFRGSSSLLSWIFGIAKNLSNNSIRRFQSRREKFESVPSEHFIPNRSLGSCAPDDELSLQRSVEAIRTEMNELPNWQRRIFEMRHLENMSIPEISAETQRSSDAIRSCLYRTKRIIFGAVDFDQEVVSR